MNAKPIKSILVVVLIVFAGLIIWIGNENRILRQAVNETELESENFKKKTIGYEIYTTYLAKGKQSISEQTKFLAATVERTDTWVQHVQKDMVFFRFNGTAILNLSTEFSFGYDLSSNKFEIVGTGSEIQIKVGKPILIGSPSVKLLSYEFLDVSMVIDQPTAALNLIKTLPALYKVKGNAIAREEAIQALCERKLIAFLRDFLAKQPDVKAVPNIRVVYQG